MSNSTLTQDQRDFIDSLSALLAGWNMQNNAARLYGYLQITQAPASLDDIARDLEMSKSNAWTAARTLEHVADVRRVTERGSKRVSFVAGTDPGAPLRKQAELLGAMAELISKQKSQIESAYVQRRMAKLAAFHKDLQSAMQAVLLPEEASDAA